MFYDERIYFRVLLIGAVRYCSGLRLVLLTLREAGMCACGE